MLRCVHYEWRLAYKSIQLLDTWNEISQEFSYYIKRQFIKFLQNLRYTFESFSIFDASFKSIT